MGSPSEVTNNQQGVEEGGQPGNTAQAQGTVPQAPAAAAAAAAPAEQAPTGKGKGYTPEPAATTTPQSSQMVAELKLRGLAHPDAFHKRV